MKRSSVILFALVFACAMKIALAQSSRIGTFDRPSIVIAYYRSPQWKAILQEKKELLAKAEKANDSAKIKQLNTWSVQAQDLGHQQLSGQAPIINILTALQPAFHEIEKSDNLSDIVPCPCPDTKGETVDVTPKLLDWLKADANTRRVIQELRRK
jgi:hypothetical protein